MGSRTNRHMDCRRNVSFDLLWGWRIPSSNCHSISSDQRHQERTQPRHQDNILQLNIKLHPRQRISIIRMWSNEWRSEDRKGVQDLESRSVFRGAFFRSLRQVFQEFWEGPSRLDFPAVHTKGFLSKWGAFRSFSTLERREVPSDEGLSVSKVSVIGHHDG